MSARYETIIVFSTTLDEEATAALLKRFTDLIAENGAVESVDEWGRRRLAYPINDEPDGYYVLVHFESDPSFIAELERICRITDGILRALVVRKEPGDPVVPAKAPVNAKPVAEAKPDAEPLPAAEPRSEQAPESGEEDAADGAAERASETTPAEA